MNSKSIRRPRRFAIAILTAVVVVIGMVGMSSPAYATTPTLVTAEDTASGFSYDSSWTATSSAANYSNSTANYASATGATATFNFTGTSVHLFGGKNSAHGIANVYVCDSTGANCGTATSVDTFAFQTGTQEELFAAYNLANSAHQLKVVVTGQKEPDSTGTTVDIDFVRYDTGATLTGTYYVSTASGCTNNGPGTQATPWCDFTNVNGSTFGPGAQVLLARGSRWTQPITLVGYGTAAAPVTIGAYGSGARPAVCGNGNVGDRTIKMNNPDNFVFRSLEICNAGMGIEAFYTSNGHSGLTFDDLYIHDITGIHAQVPNSPDVPTAYHSSGILITGEVPETTSDIAISNITVTNTLNLNNADNLDVGGFNPCPTCQQGFLETTLGAHAASNLRVQNNVYQHGYELGAFENIENSVFSGNYIEDEAETPGPGGSDSCFFWSTDHVTFANNVDADTPYFSGTPDMTGIDFENYNTNTTLVGNYFLNNAGSGFEIIGADGVSKGNLTASNGFSGNGYGNAGDYIGGMLVNSTHNTGYVRDNIYYDAHNFLIHGGAGDDVGGFATGTNWKIAASSAIYNSGSQYSSTQLQNQWGYQAYNAGSWANLSYDTTTNVWGATTAGVSRMNETTGPSNFTVARTWTAPSTGTVAITGAVARDISTAGTKSVSVQITVNGTKVWPENGGTRSISASDSKIYEATASNIAVNAGDVIRFEAIGDTSSPAGGAGVSWNPTVGYVSGGEAIVNDTSSNITYAGSWTASNSVPGYYNGDAHYSTAAGSTATFSFSGTSVDWVGGANSAHGLAQVSIDGLAPVTVDTYAPTTSDGLGSVLFDAHGLAAGTHSITVKVLGSHNSASSANYVDVDAFEFGDGIPVDLLTDDTVTGSVPAQTYSANWTAVTGVAGYFDGTAHYTGTAGSTITGKFNGSGLQIVAGANSNAGIAQVSIDGGAPVNIDFYRPVGAETTETVVFARQGLSDGAHTFTLTVTGTKDAASGSTIVDIDGYRFSSETR